MGGKHRYTPALYSRLIIKYSRTVHLLQPSQAAAAAAAMASSSGSGAASATGCYKCGRPGHWSRDCPSSNNPDSTTAANPNPNPNPSSFHHSKPPSSTSSGKPKKVPRAIPKLTPELLLSDDGLGYVLRHFPRNCKYRGRGHEVADLGNLISLYSDWHSHLLPMYSFDQFVHKVEQLGTTKRVKMCVRELKERVANGGDPTKLRETPVELTEPNNEGVGVNAAALNSEELNCVKENATLGSRDAVGEPEDMLQKIYDEVTEDAPQTLENSTLHSPEEPSQLPEGGATCPAKTMCTEEQKARMEANRQKALERAAARATQH